MGSKIESAMNDNHAELLQGYKDIAEVLNRHGITFYGMYGTALGALRHNGFIPWDDDLDLAVYSDDLDEINKVLSEELDPEKYYYHNPSADTHPHVVIKTPDFENALRNRTATFIDIFVFLNCTKSKVRQALSYPFYGLELMSHKIIDRCTSKSINELFYKIMYLSRRMVRFFSVKDAELINMRNVDVRKHVWKRSDFGEPRLHEFEDTTIPLPCHCEAYLTQSYGDYMTPPPEDQRAGATGYPYNLLNDYLEDMGLRKKHRRLLKEDLPY